MHRRRFLETAAAIPTILGSAGCASSVAKDKARAQQFAKWRAEALAAFPYERIDVRGSVALQKWEELRLEGRGAPIVIGNDWAFDRLIRPFHPDYWVHTSNPPLAEILSRADGLAHPEGLLAARTLEEQRFEKKLRKDPKFREQYESLQARLRGSSVDVDSPRPPIGPWPAHPPAVESLTVVRHWKTRRPLDLVHIVLVPTDDWTTVPAYLRWGGRNANPRPEYHVAALRSWRDRYGAELIGLGSAHMSLDDYLNIRVAKKPQSRDEALALAREHHAYCPDPINRGVGTLSDLAAGLMAHYWWSFWWHRPPAAWQPADR